MARSRRRWSLRFHGRKELTSGGGLPLAAAQASKYHVNHRRGFRSQRSKVAKMENIAAANLTLQCEPEPS